MHGTISTSSTSKTSGVIRSPRPAPRVHDGQAAYVQVYLAGHQGETLANESVDAVRRIVSATPPPNGIQAYVAGPAAVTTDQLEFGNKSARKVMGVTVRVIVLMLMIVYRSLATVLLTLLMVFIELPAVQGVDRVPGQSRCHRAFDLRGSNPSDTRHRGGHRLRDLRRRPVSRSPSGRGGPGSRLLHHVSR